MLSCLPLRRLGQSFLFLYKEMFLKFEEVFFLCLVHLKKKKTFAEIHSVLFDGNGFSTLINQKS